MECLKGALMKGRTVVLVSHHVRLCAPGAKYIVALNNGRLQFEGSSEAFLASPIMKNLVQTTDNASKGEKKEELVKSEENVPIALPEKNSESSSETGSTITPTSSQVKKERKPPRKLVEEEKRAVGRIGREIWEMYIWGCGNGWYWMIFISILIVASLSPVVENGWLRYD